MRLSRTPLGLVAAALVALPATASAEPIYTQAEIPLSFGADFSVSGYCTGTFAQCRDVVTNAPWSDAVDGDIVTMQSVALSAIAPDQSGFLRPIGNWPGFGSQAELQQDSGNSFVPSGGGIWSTASVLFWLPHPLEPNGVLTFVYTANHMGPNFATQIDTLAQNGFGATELLSGEGADAVLHFAIDYSLAPASGGSGPSDPSLVPEINGSGFAYIAFILGSLGLWLYSGAGRERETALA